MATLSRGFTKRSLISEEEIDESEEVSPGVILDYSRDGRVVGIEILGLKGFPLKELVEMRVELPTLKRER